MDFQSEFPLDPNLIYLNHAAVAPWPKRTQLAVQKFASGNTQWGATHYPEWLKVEQKLREQLRQLINANSTDEIALLKNTSEALSIVAHGINWQVGDEVIITDEEFPSNRIVWESLEKFGVKLVQVNIRNPEPENTIIEAFSDNTRLISLSSVQYASGLALDLEKIGLACKQNGILFCVDAIQSIGALPMDVNKIQADFVMADGHKWMLGPEGLALFYCKKEHIPSLTLHQFGWHMVKQAGNFDLKTWEAADTAQRFECGSPNMLTIQALSASVDVLLEAGIDQVKERIIQNTRYLRACIDQTAVLKLLSPDDLTRLSGITTFEVEGHDSQTLYQSLMTNHVICAHRGGGIRFSPHFYQDKALIDSALETVLKLTHR